MSEVIDSVMNTSFHVLLDDAAHVLSNLHFIRADWFYAFIPLVLFIMLMRNRAQSNKNWLAVIDQQLLPFVLTKGGHKRRTYPLLLTFLAGSLCITALAGPVYKKLPQPVYREQSSLVVLLDLSESMNATDIKPSRLYRAKLELLDILKTRKTGQTALVVYAAEAFIVTPLTDDNTTIANLVPALETDMMPAQGSDLSAALAKTLALFSQSGVITGDILVITDDIHQRDKAAIEKVRAQGFRLSIFGIGTADGGPVPLPDSADGGFLLDSNGAIVIPKLQQAKLQAYALAGGGVYTNLRADDSDITILSRLFQSTEITDDAKNRETSADIWQEEGHWLLLPLAVIAAFWARKGWIAAVLPFALSFLVALPPPVYAGTDQTATSNTGPDKSSPGFLDIDHLWASPDQKAMEAFNAGDAESAARQFTRPDWKASAYYRNGNYEDAVKALESPDDSDGFYNRGNALARTGKYQEAIKAYDRAIELDEKNEDAKYNREQVTKALEQQKQQQQNQQQDNSDQQDPNQQNSENEKQSQQQKQQASEDQSTEQQSQEQQSQENQQNQNQQSQDQQQGKPEQEKQNNEDQQQENQSGKQSEEENREAEEQQLKQRDAKAEQEKQQQEKQQYEQQQKEQQAENRNNEIENKKSDEKPAEIDVNPVEASITEEEKATEQWLKRIPDDPGGLLRRKFLYQYKQMPDQRDDEKPW